MVIIYFSLKRWNECIEAAKAKKTFRLTKRIVVGWKAAVAADCIRRASIAECLRECFAPAAMQIHPRLT